jgi:hypothetical protein
MTIKERGNISSERWTDIFINILTIAWLLSFIQEYHNIVCETLAIILFSMHNAMNATDELISFYHDDM